MFAAAAVCRVADEEGGGKAAAGAVGHPAMQTDPSADVWGCMKSIPDPLSQVPFRSGWPSGRRGTGFAPGGAAEATKQINIAAAAVTGIALRGAVLVPR